MSVYSFLIFKKENARHTKRETNKGRTPITENRIVTTTENAKQKEKKTLRIALNSIFIDYTAFLSYEIL